jgi:hypothetical protein
VVFALVKLRGASFDGACLAQALLLHCILLGCVTALSIAVSTRMTYGAAASVAYLLCGASFVMVPQVPELVVNGQGFGASGLMVLYYAFPHFELFDLRQRLVHDWGAAPWGTVAVVAVYGVVWFGVLLVLAWLGYRRKRFQRGQVS